MFIFCKFKQISSDSNQKKYYIVYTYKAHKIESLSKTLNKIFSLKKSQVRLWYAKLHYLGLNDKRVKKVGVPILFMLH